MIENAIQIEPFLKWPGGKRWFIEAHQNLLPKDFNRYFEPFLGSGAVFFYLKPAHAIISDINPAIIDTYKAIRTNWKSVMRSLQYHHRNHSLSYYYEIRDREDYDFIRKASRFIYLNRTCFNGIYRVNLDGKFNVPIGTKTNVLLDSDNFEVVSQLLKNTKLNSKDFAQNIGRAREGDFIFADPPYTVRHNLNGFVKYNEKLFSWDDQIRLSKVLNNAKERGVKIVMTNANHESIRDLYKGKGFSFKTVSRYSSIAASSSNRRQFEELIISANI